MKVKTNLLNMSALLSRCSFFIGGDTGISHLAAALEVPVVWLFSETDPEVLKPIGEYVYVVKSDLSCSPCSFPGTSFKCTDMKCLSVLDGIEVSNFVLTKLRRRYTSYEKKKTTEIFS